MQLLSGAQLDRLGSNGLEKLKRRHNTPIDEFSDSENKYSRLTPRLFDKDPSKARLFPGEYMYMLEKCFEFHSVERPTARELVTEVQSYLEFSPDSQTIDHSS